jgi:hypothetical protein
MAGHVERGEVPGIVTRVARRGEVHVDAKPITAAATMIPVEEGKLRLDEPAEPGAPPVLRMSASISGPRPTRRSTTEKCRSRCRFPRAPVDL